MSTVTTGQKLWCVVNFRNGRMINPPTQSEVSVTKVGKKYAELDSGDRIIIETMRIDSGGYTSPGKCYTSKEDYDATDGAALAWQKLRQDMDMRKHLDGVTIADINAARALLRI